RPSFCPCAAVYRSTALMRGRRPLARVTLPWLGTLRARAHAHLPSMGAPASFKRLLGSCLPELPRRLVKGLGARRLGVALPVGRADLADVLCRRGQWRPLPSFGFSPRVHNLEDVVDNMVLHDIR